ncbi:hypothetical protein EKG38_08505 [Shewanella canadensis]|uniref:Uncharacterized protein n=1 Tax=Shewanella canadensis TaxID=271096 RepID=A0A3S0L2I2_9GAMM|nr:hypothetical protein [Shewanella canadensis]RTR39817.1 hypothetical protein EKG38_08505 [Shewanella canadensis]
MKFNNTITNETRDVLYGMQINQELRSVYTFQLLNTVLQNHDALVTILNSSIQKPAYILLRTQFESLVKGMWLHLCAKDDEQIVKFLNNKDKIQSIYSCNSCGSESSQSRERSLQNRIKEIGTKRKDVHKCLSQFKSAYWQAFNAYTHAGLTFLDKGIDGERDMVSDQISECQAAELYSLSCKFTILAISEIGNCFDNDILYQLRHMCKDTFDPYLKDFNSSNVTAFQL